MKKFKSIFWLILIGGILYPGISIAQENEYFNTDLIKNIKWRFVGPGVYGGRIKDIEALEDNPNVIFVAAATGGIFKTLNNGISWKPVFDKAGTSLSIGDIAISRSNNKIMWAGTGESGGEQSSTSVGDGVYKSINGGESWTNMGLVKTEHIAKIVIHPDNPDVVFVGAAGRLWGPNPERGVFRTMDGGDSWEKVLYINENTGIADLVMDPGGLIIYASTYQHRRHAWGHFKRGPHTGIYRSSDGGDNWKRIQEGLPEGNTGRIAIDLARSNPDIVYASVNHKDGGVFRSDNKGLSWERVNERYQTSYWYGRIYVDPNNENKLWVMGTNLAVSIDGGKTFSTKNTANEIHVDHHVLWINPANSNHMLMGNDGGYHITYEGGLNWDFIDNLPMGQYYAIALDGRDPYWIYGGLQDNGTWGIPSRSNTNTGIMNEDAVYISGGDGFYPAIDPEDYTVVYAESQHGGLNLVNPVTGESKYIKPQPEDKKEKYRFNWNSPLFISPHDHDVLYFGGNKLFKTSNKGNTWEVISPDLSNNTDRSKWEIMGQKPTHKAYATITAIAESALQKGLIYAGTDDGNVHVTFDDGGSWKNLSGNFDLEEERYVTRIFPSNSDTGTAYIAFARYYEANDFAPYLFRTTDYGETWVSLTKNMSERAVIKGFAEHPRNPELLFAGIHNGLLISIDAGENWIRFDGDLPPVGVDDIKIAPNNDLVLGTYGRGIIILDDITLFEHLNNSVLDSDIFLFPVSMAKRHFTKTRRMFSDPAKFKAPNPPYGTKISYYLKDEVEAENNPDEVEANKTVRINILDNQNNIIRTLEAPGIKGLNTVYWDLRKSVEQETRRRMNMRGPEVKAGEYVVQLVVRGESFERTFVVE